MYREALLTGPDACPGLYYVNPPSEDGTGAAAQHHSTPFRSVFSPDFSLEAMLREAGGAPAAALAGAPGSAAPPPAGSPDPRSLHMHPLAAPYPPLEPLQHKRLAARRQATTYCYDFLSLFENALRDIWALRAAAGEPASVPPAGAWP